MGGSDPYHLADSLWMPRTTKLQQTLVYSASSMTRFDDRRITGDGAAYVTRWSNGTDFMLGNHAQGWMIQGDAAQLGVTAYPMQPGEIMLATLLAESGPITVTEAADTWMLERTTAHSGPYINIEPVNAWDAEPWSADLPEGDMGYRVWLDRATVLPQRLEIVHTTDAAQTVVLDTVVTDRHISDRVGEASAYYAYGSENQSPDGLLFQWKPGQGAVLDRRMSDDTDAGLPFVWNEANGAPMQWQLAPVGATQELSMSAFNAPRWFNMSRLSAVHRALYRVGDTQYMGVLVSQGDKELMRHVIRYSETTRGADAMPWTESRPLTVTILGMEREAWLLSHNEVAALVIELDDRLIHIMGMRSYLESQQMIDLLTWLKPTSSDVTSGGTHDDGVIWLQNLFSSPGVYRPAPYFGN
jgi:hypothetical protein